MLHQTGRAVQRLLSAAGPLLSRILLRTRKRTGDEMSLTWSPPCKTLIRRAGKRSEPVITTNVLALLEPSSRMLLLRLF